MLWSAIELEPVPFQARIKSFAYYTAHYAMMLIAYKFRMMRFFAKYFNSSGVESNVDKPHPKVPRASL